MEEKKTKKLYEVVDYDENYFDYLFNLHKDNFKGYFEEHYGKWSDNRQSRSFAKMLDSGNYKMIVAGGEVVGLINLQPPEMSENPWGGISSTPAVLRYLCIDVKARGKGIGTAVLRDIVSKYYYQCVKLKVYKDNPLAIKLYTRFGFLIDPEMSDDDYLCMFRYLPNRNVKFARLRDSQYRKELGLLPRESHEPVDIFKEL